MRSAFASLLLLLCAFSLALGGGRLSALSGAGYSLSFQGQSYGNDIATTSNDFDCSNGNIWPKDDGAVTFWAKCTQANPETGGVSCRSMLFFEGYTGATGTTYTHLLSPVLSTSPTTFTVAIKGATVPATAGYPKLGFDMFDWHHYAFSFSGRHVNVSIDGALYGQPDLGANVKTLDFCAAGATGTGTYYSTALNIGRNMFRPSTYPFQEASGQSYQGQFDEITLWNRTLTQDEIASMQTRKLSGYESGLVLYYDFNQPGAKASNRAAATGSRYDLLLGRTQGTQVIIDTATNAKYISTTPLFAPSSAPIDVENSTATPFLVFPVPKQASLYLLELTRPQGSTLTIKTLPAYASLWNTNDGVSSAGQLAQNDTITHPKGQILYTAAVASFQNDSFVVSVDGRDAFVQLLVSGVPQLLNLTLTASSGGTTFISTGVFDPLGTSWKKTIIDFPAKGLFYQVFNGTKTQPITAASPVVTHKGGYFAYDAPKVAAAAESYSFNFSVTDEAGMTSVSTCVLNVKPVPYLPTVSDTNYTVNQSSTVGVAVELKTADDNNDVLGVTVSSLPMHGKLYLTNDGVTPLAEITHPFNPYDATEGYSSVATKVLGVSSWYNTNNDYSPFQTLGNQSLSVQKDSPLANSFATRNGLNNYKTTTATWPDGSLTYTYSPDTWYDTEGYTEFLDWEFGDPVYALNMYMGICRGPGAVVKMKAMVPDGRWQTIWSGTVDKNFPAATYQQFSPTLCQTTFRTNRLRAEFNTRDSDWVEVDYVQFIGAKSLRVGVLEWNQTKVIYIPEPGYVGSDSFTFAANDCPYDRLRSANRSGVVGITVTQVPQPPVVREIITETAGNAKPINLEALDVNNEPILSFTILSLPQLGHLMAHGKTINSAPFSFSGDGLTYKPDIYKWRGERNVSFTYTAATASQQALHPETAWIELHKPGNENPILAWIALFLIIVFCSACFVLLLSRYDKHPLRTLSLVLCLILTCATTLTLNIPLSIIMFNNRYSCGFYYWSYMLFPPMFFLSIVISIYRQHFMFRLERIKKKLSREGRHEDLVSELQHYKNLTSEKRMFILCFIGFIAFLIIAAAMNDIAEETVGYDYCHSAPVITASLLVYWIVGMGTLGFALFYTRKDFTFTDFRKEIFYLIAYGLILGVLYILLIEVTSEADQFLSFALLIALIPNIYQFFAVLRPCLLTFPFLQKAKDEEGLAPLSEVIITQKGFAWFLEFCVDEFSQESPLCWKAIEQFKVKTSYQTMKDIYSKYFAPNAPLAVNLSARSLKDLQATCSSKNEETPLQELQSIFNLAQIELLQLMQEDSYFRFIGSQHYQRFRKGERVPHRYDSSNQGGSSDGSHGSSGRDKSGGAVGGSMQNVSRSGDKSNHPLTEMVSTGGSKNERVSGGGSKIESKNAVVDPLTGGWMFDIDEEGSSKPLESPSAAPRSPSGGEEAGSRSTETSPIPENEEEALKNSLVFTSNPLRRPSYV